MHHLFSRLSLVRAALAPRGCHQVSTLSGLRYTVDFTSKRECLLIAQTHLDLSRAAADIVFNFVSI
jgi:hypothetical protein